MSTSLRHMLLIIALHPLLPLPSNAIQCHPALPLPQPSRSTLSQVAEADAKKVRAVAAEVLQQRTDVEAFLVSALEEVRREMQREARQRTGGGAGPRTQVSGSGAGLRGWSAGGSSAGAGLMEGGGGDGQVDISQLSWPERERVLRALFVRINAADRKVTARQLPAGDLGSEQGRKGKGGGETLQGMG